jgi:D-3-phosphoglycerate dehydrogenase
MPVRYYEQEFKTLPSLFQVEYFQIDDDSAFVPMSESECRLKEYLGSPVELTKRMADVDVLVVQGAPVTQEVLDAAPELKLVCCARGGPVNVDVEAVTRRRLPLVTTPGKNAEAVADQTLAFLVMLARGFPEAQRFLNEGNQLKDNWEGARFIGRDLRGHTLGLVGYGQVGRRVARRAISFHMLVVVFDPYLDLESSEGLEQVGDFDELLERSDFVSLHARATPDNSNLLNAAAFAKMKRGSFFVNTARETLVDEDALDAALASGHLGGAALDVVHYRTEPGRHPLLRHENVVLTPHIGGATHETLFEGATMVAEELLRFAAGEPLVNVVNRSAVGV